MTDQELADEVRTILTREKFAVMQYAASHIETSVVRDLFADILGLRLETELLTDRIASDTYVGSTITHFPASPWQFFKLRHAESLWLRWLVRRRPVRTEPHRAGYSVTWDKRATYPDARIRFDDELGRAVVYETVSGGQFQREDDDDDD